MCPKMFLSCMTLNLHCSPPCKDGLPNDAKLIAALGAKLKRICCPKPSSGKLDVNPEIYKQWAAGGDSRNVLLKMLYQCKGLKQDRVSLKAYGNPNHTVLIVMVPPLCQDFIKHVEYQRTRMRKNKTTVESGWFTKKQMKEELKWDKYPCGHKPAVLTVVECALVQSLSVAAA